MRFGCHGEDINLTCPAGEESRITILKATYGSFGRTCTDSCCPPIPIGDCTQDMQTVHSATFEYLQQQCNGEQSCSYQFNGFVMASSCDNDDADYLQVFYECSHFTQGPVAFMVRNFERGPLSDFEVVPWRDVLTNVGSHYDSRSRTFVCPQNGIYVFSATTLTYNDQIRIDLYKNQEVLIRILANNENSDFDSSSGSVVSECLAGDVVWVQVGNGGNFLYHNFNCPLFSGFLLNKL